MLMLERLTGKLYIFFILSKVDERRHYIIISPMKKLVYMESFIKIYINIVIHYCALIFNFQIVSINFLSTCLKCK
jgi:hypothetical protein